MSDNKTTSEPVWLKVSQVADKMQLSESSIRRMIKNNEIPHRWVGGAIRIRDFIEEEAWVSNQRTTPIFPQDRSAGIRNGKTTKSGSKQTVVFPALSTPQ